MGVIKISVIGKSFSKKTGQKSVHIDTNCSGYRCGLW